MSDKLGTQNEDGLVDPDSSMRSDYIKESLPLQFGKTCSQGLRGQIYRQRELFLSRYTMQKK